MLQLRNGTGFAGTIFASPDREGIDSLYTVIKGTFTLGEQITRSPTQVPIVFADQYFGEPDKTSVRASSDICLGKPGTDVVLAGTAWAPGGQPTWQMDVSVCVGPVAKTVRVCADRVWDTGPGGTAVAWVAPFVQMPLVWERAFGGIDETDKGPVAEPRNPAGRGHRTSASNRPMRGSPLPNLEDPAKPISSPRDTPEPACFAPLASHWASRRVYAGTYDERWQRERAPFLPLDFDPRFFHVAPPELRTQGYLRGGEPVDISGATPGGVLRFQLPVVRMAIAYVVDGDTQLVPPVLDTVLIEPDASRLILVWRAALRCDKLLRKVQQVSVELTDNETERRFAA